MDSDTPTPLAADRRGHGPRLLLLHGIGSSRTAWRGQMDRLADAFDCTAPDLPGYGDSPDPDGRGLDGIVDAVAALLDGEPAHVVGVSFGALVAIALARRHPQSVRSLVLADATLGRAGENAAALERWLAHRTALAGELATRSEERAAEIAAPGAPPEIVDAIAAPMRRARPSGYLAVAHAIAAADATPWLAALRQPALVVCGEHDGVTGLAVSRAIVSAMPQARLVAIPAAGHAPHIEQPNAFATAVRDFVQAEAFAATPSPAPAPTSASGDAPFDVVLAASGRRVAVAADVSILDALLAAGEDPLFDCKRGDCGLCQVGVVDGVPDHRDHYLSAGERASNEVIQICVSRSRTATLTLDL